MNDIIVTLNAGSSSTKFAVFASDAGSLARVARGQVEGIGTAPHFQVQDEHGVLCCESFWEHSDAEAGHARAFQQISRWLTDFLEDRPIAAVGHRVAHGGPTYTEAVLIDDDVIAELTRLVPLAPLHQPHHIAAIRAVAQFDPALPQVACFDTSFHRGRARVTERFALPFEMFDAGVRRYGFHGLSYAYIVKRLKEMAPEVARGRVVVAHLGSGCSMCAIRDGGSVETSMGLSALDGLPMGTRCGTLDPGVLLYLMRRDNLDVAALESLLYKRSGLFGLSGVSNDMRALHASDDPRAAEAIDHFVFRVGRELGGLVACLGGLDALVFTAGIGENDAEIRRRVCADAAWLGIRLDDDANAKGHVKISEGDTRPSVWVIPTDEERMIALHTTAAARVGGQVS